MKTTTKTQRVKLTFSPLVQLNFEVSEQHAKELSEISNLSEFSDIGFLKSQFWGGNSGWGDQDLDLLSDIGTEIFEGECPIDHFDKQDLVGTNPAD